MAEAVAGTAVSAAMKIVHVIGAGLAGLAAGLDFAQAGWHATLYEAGPAAGGRCRSYFDKELGCRIDNGNHLVLSGNRSAMQYLDLIGGRHLLGGPGQALFPFIDVGTGERWTVAPDPGPVPWWVFRRDRRVPGTGLREHAQLLRLRLAAGDATVTEVLDTKSELYRRLLEPLAVAALNTPPDAALARLLETVVRETLGRGGRACVPLYPLQGLSEAFIDPAVAYLAARGGKLLTGQRVAGLRTEANRVMGLETQEGVVPVAKGDVVVLAVPAPVAQGVLPWLTVPDAFEAILNIHFKLHVAPLGALAQAGFLGVIGGVAEWIFIKPGVVSVTISAANRLADRTSAEIAALVWPDVCAALDLSMEMPAVRVVKERRATFAATAAQEKRRPPARTPFVNLALAGDWTATGLPATIEGAIRSGQAAAAMLLAA